MDIRMENLQLEPATRDLLRCRNAQFTFDVPQHLLPSTKVLENKTRQRKHDKWIRRFQARTQ